MSLLALGAMLVVGTLGAYGLLVLILMPADDDDADKES